MGALLPNLCSLDVQIAQFYFHLESALSWGRMESFPIEKMNAVTIKQCARQLSLAGNNGVGRRLSKVPNGCVMNKLIASIQALFPAR